MRSESAYAAPASARIGSRAALRPRVAALAGRDSDLLLGIALIAMAVTMLVMVRLAVHQDTWLALLAGRDIAHSGIPGHETLTVIPHGKQWVDQQWLAQLVMYWIYQVGGIVLVSVANIGLIAAAFGGALVGARRLGASAPSVIRVLPMAAALVVFGTEVRTQPYSYGLFVATIYLIARDSRRPSRAVYLCLPLIVLWGNVHGSAFLGAGLLSLRGLTVAWERRAELTSRARAWARPAILTLAGPLCLFATPYGTSMLSYYQHTLLNSSFRRYVTEWQPITSLPILAAFFFPLVAFMFWSLGRHAKQTTLWERCALIALAALGVTAVRNAQWFGFAALMLLPMSIDAAVRPRAAGNQTRPALNLALLAVAAVALIAVLASTVGRGAAAFAKPYPDSALAAVSRVTASSPGMRVFADETYADWLLWRLPSLRGRVAYDARFEQLTSKQIESVVRLKLAIGLHWKRAAHGYRLLVFRSSDPPDGVKALRAEPGRRILYDHHGVLVILRSAAQAAR